MKTVHSTFGKAAYPKQTAALSFSRSAKDNCDPACRLWANCYASRIERIYAGLNKKLINHKKMGPTRLVNKAIAEIRDQAYRWARISVDGSLPAKQSVSQREWRRFVPALRRYVAELKRRGALWHIPVESPQKARSYRAALKGLGVVVRRTSQARSVSELLQSTDERSWVVAERIHAGCVTKEEKQRNTEKAYQVANQIRLSGQTAVVCPAVVGSSKCGKCTACADSRVDVVLYPFHP